MNLQIYSKNLELSESDKNYLESKLQKLDKRIRKLVSARVDISRDRHHRKGDILRVEINLRLPHKLLRGVVKGSEIENSIDLVLEKLHKQIERYKEKIK